MALYFDGSSYIEANSFCAYMVNVDFTLAFWFKWKSSPVNYPILIALNTAATGNRLLIMIYSNDAGKFGIFDVAAHKGTADLQDSLWHHAAVTYNDTTQKMIGYIDGEVEIAEFSSAVAPSSSDLFSFGQEWDKEEWDEGATPSDLFNGDMCSAGVWSACLTPTQVAQLADGESPAAVQSANLRGYLTMIDGVTEYVSGLSVTNHGTTISAHPPRMYAPRRRKLLLENAL